MHALAFLRMEPAGAERDRREARRVSELARANQTPYIFDPLCPRAADAAKPPHLCRLSDSLAPTIHHGPRQFDDSAADRFQSLRALRSEEHTSELQSRRDLV